MIQFFAIPSTDQSIYYLSQVFGVVGSVLPQSGATSLILGVMFKTFNTTILSVAVLIVLYVSIVGVLKTAQEGEFLGRNWNSIWVPIRMVIGIAALIPTPSGYCTIQIVVMWIVLQGIGAADVIWNTVLTYSTVAGSPVASVGIPSVGYTNTMQNLFQSLVCQETAYSSSSFTFGDVGGYYCYDPISRARKSDPFCNLSPSEYQDLTNSQVSSTNTVTSPSGKNTYIRAYNIGPSGKCGSMTFCDATTTCSNAGNDPAQKILCAACTAQQSTLQNSLTLLSGIASLFNSADLEFRQWMSAVVPSNPPSGIQAYCNANGISTKNCCVRSSMLMSNCAISNNTFSQGTGSDADQSTVSSLYWPYLIKPNLSQADFISVVTSNYIAAIQSAVISTLSNSNTQITDKILQQAGQQGWIFAGAYYYYLAKQNNAISDTTVPSLTIAVSSGLGDDLRSNYSAASNLASTLAVSASSNSFTGTLPPKLSQLSRLSNELNASGASVISSFMNTITGAQSGQPATNPLASLQNLGKNLLITAQVLFAVMMAVIIPLALIGNLDVFVLGTGVIDSIGPTLTTLSIFIAPLFMLLLGALFTFGAMLAVYVPLIPYIVFVMGVIAWFILIIEAMIAAPLVALGILSPSAQHEVLGKAEHALMHLFGIFLRPSLMIFGMIAAMLLSIAVITMINASFSAVVASIYDNLGLVELILFVCAYVSLILTALNKCFSLIHIIPDRVLRWIGHHGGAEEAGAAEALGAAKSNVGAGAGAAAAGGQTAAGRAQVAGKSLKELKDLKNAKKGTEDKGGPTQS